jgi:hypothetical protein
MKGDKNAKSVFFIFLPNKTNADDYYALAEFYVRLKRRSYDSSI